MTLTAIFTPGAGSSKGMVFVVSICSHFSGSFYRLNASGHLHFLPVLVAFGKIPKLSCHVVRWSVTDGSLVNSRRTLPIHSASSPSAWAIVSSI